MDIALPVSGGVFCLRNLLQPTQKSIPAKLASGMVYSCAKRLKWEDMVHVKAAE